MRTIDSKDGEKELGQETVIKMVKKMRDKKATWMNGIPVEVWKYGGEKLWEWIWRMCNRV